MDGADHDWLIALGAFFQHGKQVVLLAKLAHQPIAAEQADLTNPPVPAAGVKHPIGEERLVRAMKRAETKMHNTRTQLAAVILRELYAFRQRSRSYGSHS